MQITDYQEQAMKTAIYGEGAKINYPILGLCGEAGELANKYKKVLRDDSGNLSEEKRKAMLDEAGDCLWYLSAICRDLGSDLSEVAKNNIIKLQKRYLEGTIKGSGDNR